MNNSIAVGCLIASIRLLTTLPIWYYLLYQILLRVEGNELMFFLFWMYVPLGMILAIAEGIFTVAAREYNSKKSS